MRVGDTNLGNPEHVEGVLRAWIYIMDLSENYPDLLDLRIEIEDRVRLANLTSLEKGVLAALVEDRVQIKAAEDLGVSVNTLRKTKDALLRKIAEADGTPRKKKRPPLLASLFGGLLGW